MQPRVIEIIEVSDGAPCHRLIRVSDIASVTKQKGFYAMVYMNDGDVYSVSSPTYNKLKELLEIFSP